MLTRRALLAALAATAALPARARPQRYRLDREASRVGFTYTLSGSQQTGEMPVSQADLFVDPEDLAQSRADVSVSAENARTGIFYATAALKSAAVLDTARWPEIRFVSTGVQLAPSGRLSDGAVLNGNLSVRGITRPIALRADLYREAGSATDDLSVLSLRLRGQISRAAFGATGYPALVADPVGLDIRATVRAETEG